MYITPDRQKLNFYICVLKNMMDIELYLNYNKWKNKHL